MSKILVIDDEDSIRSLLKLSLTHKGYSDPVFCLTSYFALE